jgi:hypothetical protein
MTEVEGIKQVLGKLVQAIELMADETAELVDKYHRPHLIPEAHHTVVARSRALVSAAESLRLVAEKVLDKTDLPPLPAKVNS